jgi:hypothetical protein
VFQGINCVVIMAVMFVPCYQIGDESERDAQASLSRSVPTAEERASAYTAGMERARLAVGELGMNFSADVPAPTYQPKLPRVSTKHVTVSGPAPLSYEEDAELGADPDSDDADFVSSFVAQFRAHTDGSDDVTEPSVVSAAAASHSLRHSTAEATVPCLPDDDDTCSDQGAMSLITAVLPMAAFSRDSDVVVDDIAVSMSDLGMPLMSESPAEVRTTEEAVPEESSSGSSTAVTEHSRVPVLRVFVDGRWQEILLSAALAMLRINRRLSADRMLRITQAMSQKATVQANAMVNEQWLVPSLYVCVRFETTMEIGKVVSIGAFKAKGRGVAYCTEPVSLTTRQEGLFVWLSWLEVATDIEAIRTCPDFVTEPEIPLYSPLYQYYKPFYTDPGVMFPCR